jgi:hypothetical protein
VKRFAFLSVVLFSCFSFIPVAFAQTKPATAPAGTTAPATQAKWVTPVKGIANVEVIQSTPKKVGDELVTSLKVKNISDGAIAMLKVDEYWYDKKRETVSACTERVRQPINPKQIVDIEVKCAYKADIDTNQFFFSHANGDIKAKSVKAFSGDTKK